MTDDSTRDATVAYFPGSSQKVQYLEASDDVPMDLDGEHLDVRFVGSSRESFQAAVRNASGEHPHLLLRGDMRRVYAILTSVTEVLADEDDVAKAFRALDVAPSRAAVNMARDGLEAWDRLRNDYGVLTAAELADRSGSRAANRSGYANDLVRHGRAFAVKRARTAHLPAYQFDASGSVYPAVAPVLETFRDARWSDFSVAIWFASPTTWLSGERPADLLPDEEETERLVRAAQRTVHT